jgi:CelD/BcsL family acetyltransferase involved in cellulose biosynthesis/RimJ/RimL family protein N-acetyltransferase
VYNRRVFCFFGKILSSSLCPLATFFSIEKSPSSYQMNFSLARKTEARNLISDANFLRDWEALYQNCSWATVFQSPVFVKTWYEIYGEVFDLLFVYETNEAENLNGLFPLAIEKSSGKICAAGDYHAEYQTWLACEENANSFVEKAFDRLRRDFFEQRLELLFLAPNTPLIWFENKKKWGGQTNLLTHLHPLIEIGNGEKSEESLRKKGNKTRFRQLNKIGEVRLETLRTPEELEPIFDEIEDYMKLRMSALHNVLPEYDARRKPFHLALMKNSDFIHASLLKAGDKIASAKIALRNRGEMLLSVTSMSPFFARQSPSKLHILLLGKAFAKEKIPVFDLSPGAGYKERFATHCKEANSITVFFNKADFLRYKSKRKVYGLTKERLEQLNIAKTKVFAFSDKLLHKLRRVKYRTVPGTILKNTRRKIFERRECRIYSFDVQKIALLENPNLMRRDSVADLLKYVPAEGWQLTVSQFHKVCLERFENGNHSFTFADDDTLLHYGWLIERQEISDVSEVRQKFELPPNSAVLFDFYTHPKARGRGLYKKSLLQGLHSAAQIAGTEQVFIGVMADNLASRRVIEKTGFVYRGSLFNETRFGKIKKWQIWDAKMSEKSDSASLNENFEETRINAEEYELSRTTP